MGYITKEFNRNQLGHLGTQFALILSGKMGAVQTVPVVYTSKPGKMMPDPKQNIHVYLED